MNKLALVVDPQIDFIWGSMAVPGAVEAMNYTALKLYNEDYNDIIITKDWHPKNHCSFKDYGGIWPEHCIQNTEGAYLYPGLLQVLRKICTSYEIFNKGENPNKEEYSVFDDPINNILIKGEYLIIHPEIHVYGIAGDYCVKETLQSLINLGFKEDIIVHTKGIASINEKEFIKFIQDQCLIFC